MHAALPARSKVGDRRRLRLELLRRFKWQQQITHKKTIACSAPWLRAPGRPCAKARRRRPLVPPRPAPRPPHAAADPAPASSGGSGELVDRASSLITSLTDLFPAWVLGAVTWAAVQPAAFTWFHPASSGQPALTLTLLAVGLQLQLEVGPCRWFGFGDSNSQQVLSTSMIKQRWSIGQRYHTPQFAGFQIGLAGPHPRRFCTSVRHHAPPGSVDSQAGQPVGALYHRVRFRAPRSRMHGLAPRLPPPRRRRLVCCLKQPRRQPLK